MEYWCSPYIFETINMKVKAFTKGLLFKTKWRIESLSWMNPSQWIVKNPPMHHLFRIENRSYDLKQYSNGGFNRTASELKYSLPNNWKNVYEKITTRICYLLHIHHFPFSTIYCHNRIGHLHNRCNIYCSDGLQLIMTVRRFLLWPISAVEVQAKNSF